jgi:hypothetical protein
MNKIVITLLSLPVGAIVGGFAGAYALRSVFGTGTHMDASAFAGLMLGFPIGAIVFGACGLALGWMVDRLVNSRLSPSSWKKVGVPTAIGIALGVATAFFARDQATPVIIGGWFGLLAGFLWNLVSDVRRQPSAGNPLQATSPK